MSVIDVGRSPMPSDAGRAVALLGRMATTRPEGDELAAAIKEVTGPLARLGFRRIETVLHWLDAGVLPGFAPRLETDERGRRWLAEELPRHAHLIDDALEAACQELGDGAAGSPPSGLRDMIANSLENQGRYAEALALVEELAAEGDPLGRRRATVAWLRARLGDPSLAREMMDDGSLTELSRARLAAAVGERDRAVELLRAALSHNPEIRPEHEGGFETLFEYEPYLAVFGPPQP